MTALLAPDPALPQRDALLDERHMAGVLGAARCERINAKYRVGDSLRVVYRLDDERIVAGRTFGSRSASVYRRAAARMPGGVLHAEPLAAVFWRFPHDRRLAGLRLLDDRAALGELLGRPVARARLMAYAPERAATAECLDDAGGVLAYVKVHWDAAERELANAEAAAAAVGTGDPHLRLPRVLAASLPARRFDRLDPERLALAAEVVGRARPDCAQAADALLERLAEGPPEGELVHLHGDANLRNALLDGERVGLVDLEDATAGPPAADLGFVLAGLLTCAEEGAALLDGYGRIARVPSDESLRWHTAASLLARIAVPAVGRVRPALLRRLGVLLREAGELVA